MTWHDIKSTLLREPRVRHLGVRFPVAVDVATINCTPIARGPALSGLARCLCGLGHCHWLLAVSLNTAWVQISAGHVRSFPVTWGYAVVFARYSGFLKIQNSSIEYCIYSIGSFSHNNGQDSNTHNYQWNIVSVSDFEESLILLAYWKEDSTITHLGPVIRHCLMVWNCLILAIWMTRLKRSFLLFKIISTKFVEIRHLVNVKYHWKYCWYIFC